jgi:hypothetical protein
MLESTVHGALRIYDLPDLVRSIAPDRITIEQDKSPQSSN